MQDDEPWSRQHTIGLICWLVVAAWIGLVLSYHGTRWEFGPKYGLPVPLIEEDGRYKDGTEPDPINYGMWKSGQAEEQMLWLLLAAVAIVPWCFWSEAKRKRRERGRR